MYYNNFTKENIKKIALGIYNNLLGEYGSFAMNLILREKEKDEFFIEDDVIKIFIPKVFLPKKWNYEDEEVNVEEEMFDNPIFAGRFISFACENLMPLILKEFSYPCEHKRKKDHNDVIPCSEYIETETREFLEEDEDPRLETGFYFDNQWYALDEFIFLNEDFWDGILFFTYDSGMVIKTGKDQTVIVGKF